MPSITLTAHEFERLRERKLALRKTTSDGDYEIFEKLVPMGLPPEIFWHHGLRWRAHAYIGAWPERLESRWFIAEMHDPHRTGEYEIRLYRLAAILRPKKTNAG